MAIQDSRFNSLRAQGFTGTNDDMMLQWAQAAGATSNHVNDAVLEALLLNGATTPCLSDAWVEYLISIGGDGTRNDMEDAFWVSGGEIVPPVIPPDDPVGDHWARVSDQSDATLLTHLTALIDELVLKGIWDQLTDLCVLHTNAADSLLGLKGVADSTNFNSCAFIQDQGFFCGDDTQDRYIDTGIRKAVPVAGVDDDDMSCFMYRFDRSDNITGSLGSMGSRDGGDNVLSLSIQNNNNNDYSVGTVGVTAIQVTGERNRFTGVSRTNATNVITVRDNVSNVTSVASTGGAPSVNNVVVGGYMTDGVFTSAIGTEMVMAWGVGASLTASQLLDLNAAIDVYVASRTAAISASNYITHVLRLNNRRGFEIFESNLARLFEELEGTGVYAKLDEVWVNHKNALDMLLGIKGFRDAVTVGGPAWAAPGGYLVGNSGGTASYLTLNIVDDGTTLFSDDSMSMFVVRRFANTASASSVGIMGVWDGGDRDAYLAISSASFSRSRFGHTTPDDFIAEGGNGFLGATRNSVNTGWMIKNGVTEATTSAATAGAPKTFLTYVGGVNKEGIYDHAAEDVRVSAWGMGGGLLEADLVALDAIIMRYLTGIGSV